MRNFKNKGSMMSDPFKKSNSKDQELSSDSSIEALVDKGMQNAYTIAEKTMKENLHPFAISFLLSLNNEQLRILSEK